MSDPAKGDENRPFKKGETAELTFHGDTFQEFIDQDVKDDPELRMKSPPVIPIILHPDSLRGLDRK